MGRPRKQPDPDEPSGEEPSGKTVKLKYTGPAGQVLQGVDVGGGLEEGTTYEVPEKIGESLVKYSAFWEKA